MALLEWPSTSTHRGKEGGPLGREHGYTLLELLLAVAILAIMSSLAMFAGANWVTSARKAKAAAHLVDHLSLAREQAIAKHQRWQITFFPQGAPVATGFLVQACTLPHGFDPTADCINAWETQHSVEFELGVGITNHPPALTFNRLGHFENSSNINMLVCTTYITGGAVGCNPNSSTRTIEIMSFSGVVRRY